MTTHDDPSAAGHTPASHRHAADQHAADQHAAADPLCADAIRNLYLFLDGEMGPAEVAAVQAHLNDCSPCFEAYDFEAEFRMVIASKGAAPIPPDVRQRLESMIQSLGDPAGPGGPGGLGGLGGPGGPGGPLG